MATIWYSVSALAMHLDACRAELFPFRIVMTSGGYDCLHVGHLRNLQASRDYGECLVVVVNGDGFLMRKKGYIFMPLDQRMEIIAGIAGVDHVVPWDDGSQFVHGAIRLLSPNYFTKGGDRSTLESIAECEKRACESVGCELVLGVGGSDKIQSSSQLVKSQEETCTKKPSSISAARN